MTAVHPPQSDRELLELAAKAAGYQLKWQGNDAWLVEHGQSIKHWSPLHDDGDALRLAVAISNNLRVICLSIGCGKTGCEFHFVHHGVDAATATRRAIVIAAAEIGRSLAHQRAGRQP